MLLVYILDDVVVVVGGGGGGNSCVWWASGVALLSTGLFSALSWTSVNSVKVEPIL